MCTKRFQQPPVEQWGGGRGKEGSKVKEKERSGRGGKKKNPQEGAISVHEKRVLLPDGVGREADDLVESICTAT